ncbi:MAG: hypothetical protein WBP22_00780 [Candidatus Saccharimonas sp.]
MSHSRKLAATACKVLVVALLLTGLIWSWPKPYTATITVQDAAYGGVYRAGIFESTYYAIQTHEGAIYKCLTTSPTCALIRKGNVVEARFNDGYMTMDKITIIRQQE